MASSSCSGWWRAPIYFTVSVILAFIAISSSLHSSGSGTTPMPNRPINRQLILNASIALRKSGFNLMATLLLISPELRISKECCFKRRKNVALTMVDAKERLLEINHVLVSHPDLFLEGNLAIHGVLGPFSFLGSGFKDFDKIWDFSIQAPICDSNFSLVLDIDETKNLIEWTRIVRLLSSNGFVSFAIGLNYVLDGILEDFRDLYSVTIFTPQEFEFLASPSPVLDRVVRLHILPQRITYSEFASLPEKKLLGTLLSGQELQVTAGFNGSQGIFINGVEIVAPEIISAKQFIIHGISQAFHVAELPDTSR
ncbi:fasciclin-like arabinogalactan protein 21 [Jatropha curcas]|uniref:fasciclin-like arabinogalactan protein 21 n=1 Tax=Jatropha curcas TaxID=180498 RepID=UPI00189639C5|nr:fasciclin-like arabinogalactan protein 21 [Jatropha curcas]